MSPTRVEGSRHSGPRAGIQGWGGRAQQRPANAENQSTSRALPRSPKAGGCRCARVATLTRTEQLALVGRLYTTRRSDLNLAPSTGTRRKMSVLSALHTAYRRHPVPRLTYLIYPALLLVSAALVSAACSDLVDTTPAAEDTPVGRYSPDLQNTPVTRYSPDLQNTPVTRIFARHSRTRPSHGIRPSRRTHPSHGIRPILRTRLSPSTHPSARTRSSTSSGITPRRSSTPSGTGAAT